MGQIDFLDAADSVFFPRQLEHIQAQVYAKLYPQYLARQYVPVNSEGGWASLLTYRETDLQGASKLISNYADDLPMVQGSATETSLKVRDYGVAAYWSLREINRAREIGSSLDVSRLADARRVAEAGLDAVAALGDSVAGLEGILNHSAVNAATVATGVAGYTWALKTADEIVTDFISVIQTMRSNTKTVYSPTHFVIPDTSFVELSTRRMSTQTDTNILDYALMRLRSLGVQGILPWYYCETAGADSTKRMVAMVRSPEAGELMIPQDFQVLAPQQKNLSVMVPTMLSTAGFKVRVPYAFEYRDGI
jgi:hypothetical protein